MLFRSVADLDPDKCFFKDFFLLLSKQETYFFVSHSCMWILQYFGVNIGIGAHQGEGTQPPSLALATWDR